MVSYEFDCFLIRRITLPYHQIVHISSQMSIWDRITRAGTVTIRTARDDCPDLHLRYVPRPRLVERMLVDHIENAQTL